MKEILTRLEELLIRKHASVLHSLNDGIDPFKLNEIIKSLSINLPGDIKNLYEWKDGSHVDYNPALGSRHLFRNGILMPIRNAIEEYRVFVNGDFQYYSDFFFPLFESMGDQFFVVDCNPKSDTFEMILSYEIKYVFSTNGAWPKFDSPRKMIETIIKCLEDEAYFYLEGNPRLQINLEREAEIVRSMNPLSEAIRNGKKT